MNLSKRNKVSTDKETTMDLVGFLETLGKQRFGWHIKLFEIVAVSLDNTADIVR